MEFKRKKLLTRPILKMEQDKPRYVKVEQAMFIGKEIKDSRLKDDDKGKGPAMILNCINLETGEQVQIVCNAVLKSVLAEEYPNDTYVGKCFMITKMGRQPGKQYNPFHIEEIEEPTPEPVAESPDVPAMHAAGGKRR